jgi:hypothetical protein
VKEMILCRTLAIFLTLYIPQPRGLVMCAQCRSKAERLRPEIVIISRRLAQTNQRCAHTRNAYQAVRCQLTPFSDLLFSLPCAMQVSRIHFDCSAAQWSWASRDTVSLYTAQREVQSFIRTDNMTLFPREMARQRGLAGEFPDQNGQESD